MLTPAFELKQDDEWLTVFVKAPYAKISETEIYIDGNEFKFYSKPYYLRLNLPGNVLEDGRETAKYESEKGSFEIRIPKETPGEYFEGLDMLTKLLAAVGQKSAASPSIEVLDDDQEIHAEDGYDEEEEEFDWQIEQEVYDESEDCPVTLETPMYGFANQRSSVFKRLQQELHDIIDLKDADNTPMAERRSLRLLDEQDSFSDDHYLADMFQDEVIQEILKYKPVWLWEYSSIKNKQKEESVVEFTGEEKEKMRKLPRKEYLLDSKSQQVAFLGLVDIIFAYCYNSRTTEGENNVESGWTISKLSGTLSWLETYKNLRDVIVTSYRRCLCFPLYRSWRLNKKVFRDVQKIFTIGRRRILKCLLEIKDLLQDSDSRYILNDLYITDYCVWIQSVSQRKLESLTRCLKEVVIEKEDLALDLVELEMAAKLAMNETDEASNKGEDVENLSQQLSNVNLDADTSLIESSAADTPRKSIIELKDNPTDSPDYRKDTKKAEQNASRDTEELVDSCGVEDSQQTQYKGTETCESSESEETEDSSSEYTTDSESSEEECGEMSKTDAVLEPKDHSSPLVDPATIVDISETKCVKDNAESQDKNNEKSDEKS